MPDILDCNYHPITVGEHLWLEHLSPCEAFPDGLHAQTPVTVTAIEGDCADYKLYIKPYFACQPELHAIPYLTPYDDFVVCTTNHSVVMARTGTVSVPTPNRQQAMLVADKCVSPQDVEWDSDCTASDVIE